MTRCSQHGMARQGKKQRREERDTKQARTSSQAGTDKSFRQKFVSVNLGFFPRQLNAPFFCLPIRGHIPFCLSDYSRYGRADRLVRPTLASRSPCHSVEQRRSAPWPSYLAFFFWSVACHLLFCFSGVLCCIHFAISQTLSFPLIFQASGLVANRSIEVSAIWLVKHSFPPPTETRIPPIRVVGSACYTTY